MKKVDLMDKYFDSNQGTITSSEICSMVSSIFSVDLETKSILAEEISSSKNQAKMAIDAGLAKYGKNISGAEVRELINQIFGINLDAVSALDGSRISLFSKNQWILRHAQDLFVVHSGQGDVDVMIYPTDYFTEVTNLNDLPEDLQQSLIELGYSLDKKVGRYYYSDPYEKAIPDTFKGQTIGAILKVIQNSYQNI